MLLTSTTDFKHSHDEATVLKWDQACWISLQMWTVFAEPHWINLMSSYSCTQWLKYRLFELAIGPKGFFTDVSLLKLQIFLLKPKNDVTNFVDVCCSTVLSAQDGWVGTCRTWRHPAFRVPGKVILHISVTSGGSSDFSWWEGEGAVQLLTYFGQFSLKTAWKCRNLDRSRIPGTSAWIRHFLRCVNVFETSKDANPNMTSLTRNKFKFPVQPSKKLVQRWKLMGRKHFGVCFGTLTLLIDITCH